MNSRSVIILAVLVLGVCGVAIWFLNSTPGTPPLPAIVTATPSPAIPLATPPGSQAAQSVPSTKPKPKAEPGSPTAAAEVNTWSDKIDKIISSNSDNSEAAHAAATQMLINLLPTLPPEGQAEAAQHISNLLDDKDYGKVLPLVKNPQLSEDVLDVFVTDLMNRDDKIKLPTLLEIAKIPNHPHREEAATDLQIYLEEDYGTDWTKWDTALKAYLKKQADENPPETTPLVPAK